MSDSIQKNCEGTSFNRIDFNLTNPSFSEPKYRFDGTLCSRQTSLR